MKRAYSGSTYGVQKKSGSQSFGKRYTGSGYTKKSATALIAAIKRKKFGMYRGIKPEIKTVDTVIASSVVTATPQFFLLNGTQQGTGTFNRIGTKVNLRSLQFRGSYEPQAAQAFCDSLRILVVWDKNANKTIPTFADIIQSKSQDGTVTSLIDDMRNIDNTERFKMIYDQEFYLPAVAASPFTTNFNSDFQGVIDWYKKLNLPTQYTGTANPAVVAQITSGSLYMIMFTGGTTGYGVSGTVRVRFDDH